MSSIKTTKKLLNYNINNLVDECYNFQIEMPSSKAKSDLLIEEILEYYDFALSKLKRTNSKKDLLGFKEELEQKSNDFYQEIMNLHIS